MSCTKWSILKCWIRAYLMLLEDTIDASIQVYIAMYVYSHTVKALVSYFNKLITRDQSFYWYSKVTVKQKYCIVLRTTSLCKTIFYIYSKEIWLPKMHLKNFTISICNNSNHYHNWHLYEASLLACHMYSIH